MFSDCDPGKDSWEFLGQQGDQTSQYWKKSILNTQWKDWCWSWSSNNLANWCNEPTHWKRPWCWERLRAGGEGDDRGWDDWMESPMQWMWNWANSRRWWGTEKPSVLQLMGLWRIGHDLAPEQQQQYKAEMVEWCQGLCWGAVWWVGEILGTRGKEALINCA